MESRPVFADPSGRRHQILRFAGFGFMAAVAACLVAIVVAMTGGPQAPFTQWAGPPATAKHNPQQAGTVPLGHATVSGIPASGNGGGGTGGTAPGRPGSPATTSPPSASTSAKPSPTAGSTPSATTTSSATATTTATATSPGHGKSSGHGNPHNTASPTPTA